jgi:hypothetical protein
MKHTDPLGVLPCSAHTLQRLSAVEKIVAERLQLRTCPNVSWTVALDQCIISVASDLLN